MESVNIGRLVSNVLKNDLFGNDPVTKYVLDHSLRLHPAQEKLIEITRSHPRAVMMSSSDQIQLLQNIVSALGARRTIDVGTFTGYSALSIALVLPSDGKLVTCDVTSEHLSSAQEIWKEAGVDKIVDFRLGPAIETLRSLLQEDGPESYDFVFIDAYKQEYDQYYELALQLVRPKGLIAIDNVLWGGTVVDPSHNDASVAALRSLNDKLAHDPRINISMLQLGDGTTLCFKK